MPVAPTVSAVTASAVTDSEATVSGTVTPHGEDTEYAFEFGTTTDYLDGPTPSTAVGSGTTAQPATAALTGLVPNETYHVRLAATSDSGITYGPDLTFTTTATGAPSATSLAASAVDADSATLEATVDPRGTATEAWFAYGTEAAGLTTRIPLTNASVGDGSAAVPFDQQLTGLEPNTTYGFRVVAKSANDTTEGAIETFTTDALAPIATTEAADAITRTGATLNATIDPRNSATTYAFEWGPTETYGNRTPALDAYVAADHASHPVDEPLTGLAAGQTHHFRVVATSDAGVTDGPDRTFTTDPAGAPGASVLPATGVTATGATLRGSVNPEDAPTSYQFVWGTPGDLTAHRTPAAPEAVGSDATDRPVSETLTGLEPVTTYVFAVVASGNATTTSTSGSFTTDAVAPTATTGAADATTSTGATLHATIDPRGSATSYAFEWGTSSAYGNRARAVDVEVGAGHGPRPVQQALTGLAGGTTYHVRVVARSAAGVTEGADRTFTTDPGPGPGPGRTVAARRDSGAVRVAQACLRAHRRRLGPRRDGPLPRSGQRRLRRGPRGRRDPDGFRRGHPRRHHRARERAGRHRSHADRPLPPRGVPHGLVPHGRRHRRHHAHGAPDGLRPPPRGARCPTRQGPDQAVELGQEGQVPHERAQQRRGRPRHGVVDHGGLCRDAHPGGQGQRGGQGPAHGQDGARPRRPHVPGAAQAVSVAGGPLRAGLLLAAVLAIGAGLLAQLSGALHGAEQRTVAARFDVRGAHVPGDVALVLVDDATFDLGMRWPFPRSEHAEVIDRLHAADAREIAYDVQFTERTTDREDLALFTAIDRAGGAVLATSESQDGRTNVLGGDENLASIGARAAAANLFDGAVSRFPYATDGLQSLAVAVAGRSGRPAPPSSAFGTEGAWIDFRGPPGTIPPPRSGTCSEAGSILQSSPTASWSWAPPPPASGTCTPPSPPTAPWPAPRSRRTRSGRRFTACRCATPAPPSTWRCSCCSGPASRCCGCA